MTEKLQISWLWLWPEIFLMLFWIYICIRVSNEVADRPSGPMTGDPGRVNRLLPSAASWRSSGHIVWFSQAAFLSGMCLFPLNATVSHHIHFQMPVVDMGWLSVAFSGCDSQKYSSRFQFGFKEFHILNEVWNLVIAVGKECAKNLIVRRSF